MKTKKTLGARFRELELKVERLTDHVNREIGVAQDGPTHAAVEMIEIETAPLRKVAKALAQNAGTDALCVDYKLQSILDRLAALEKQVAVVNGDLSTEIRTSSIDQGVVLNNFTLVNQKIAAIERSVAKLDAQKEDLRQGYNDHIIAHRSGVFGEEAKGLGQQPTAPAALDVEVARLSNAAVSKGSEFVGKQPNLKYPQFPIKCLLHRCGCDAHSIELEKASEDVRNPLNHPTPAAFESVEGWWRIGMFSITAADLLRMGIPYRTDTACRQVDSEKLAARINDFLAKGTK